jgi:hypothetical protein
VESAASVIDDFISHAREHVRLDKPVHVSHHALRDRSGTTNSPLSPLSAFQDLLDSALLPLKRPFREILEHAPAALPRLNRLDIILALCPWSRKAKLDHDYGRRTRRTGGENNVVVHRTRSAFDAVPDVTEERGRGVRVE